MADAPSVKLIVRRKGCLIFLVYGLQEMPHLRISRRGMLPKKAAVIGVKAIGAVIICGHVHPWSLRFVDL